MKTFKNKADKTAYFFILAVKVLIPVAFLLIAVSEGKAYWLGGVMFILVVFSYVLQLNGIGNANKT